MPAEMQSQDYTCEVRDASGKVLFSYDWHVAGSDPDRNRGEVLYCFACRLIAEARASYRDARHNSLQEAEEVKRNGRA
jgi:hypothetical protein